MNLLRRILSSIDTFSAQQIYQSMIMSIFTYCGYNTLGWSESRKSMIRSIEKRSLEIISPKCSQKNSDLRFLIIDNVLQKKTCCFVFGCLLRMELHVSLLCFQYYVFITIFNNFTIILLNTRNNGKAAKLPKVKLDFAPRRQLYFLGASIHCHSAFTANSKILFRKALDDFYF